MSPVMVAIAGMAVLVIILYLAIRDELLHNREQQPSGTLRAVWDGMDRRQYPRYMLSCSMRYRVQPSDNQTTTQAHLWDISEGGCAVQLPEKLSPGSYVNFEVDWQIAGNSSSSPTLAKGEVVWSRELPRKPLAQRVFLTGVRFEEAKQDTLAELLKAARARGPATEDPDQQSHPIKSRSTWSEA